MKYNQFCETRFQSTYTVADHINNELHKRGVITVLGSPNDGTWAIKTSLAHAAIVGEVLESYPTKESKD